MKNPNPSWDWNRLLLMAAAALGLGPATDLTLANSAKVVGQALRWAGLTDDEVRSAWMGEDDCPVINGCSAALATMIRHGPAGEALFEGAGNWGTASSPAAYPHFTSCRLTARGLRLAERLLLEHPHYRECLVVIFPPARKARRMCNPPSPAQNGREF